MSGVARVGDDVATRASLELEQIRRNVQALGGAMHAIQFTESPAVARATAAQERLYSALAAEFGLLTSAEVADRMGSRASAARRNLASQARRDGRLLGLRRGRSWVYPGFQFDAVGARPVIAELRQVAERHGWDETSLIEWLMGPTTYLDGARPVDALDDPERVLQVAEDAFGVSW